MTAVKPEGRFRVLDIENNSVLSFREKSQDDMVILFVLVCDSSNKLSMKSEFSIEEKQNISGFDLFDESQTNTNSMNCKVYDVILAGVYR